MKKKHAVSLAAASALAATTMMAAPFAVAKQVPATSPTVGQASASTGPVFSAESMDPQIVEQLKAKGVDVKEPQPKGLKLKNPNSKPEYDTPYPQEHLDAVQKNLAILVKFPEENGHSPVPGSPDERIPAKYFNDLLYGTSYNPYELPQFANQAVAPDGTKAPTDHTLHNYYSEISYGKVNVTTDDSPEKVGWVVAPHPYSYYFGDTGSLPTSESDYNANGFGDYPHNAQGLVEDVVKAADAQIDFSKYADANGEIPGVFIIHEGTGGEWSRDPQQFWSHKWELPEPLTVDGVKVSKYSMEPEYGGNLAGYNAATGTYQAAAKTGPFPPYVGVYAHEFGHILGLPDLYDYGYDSQGVGAWSVMAGGSWGRYPNYLQYNGNTPVQLDAWNRYFAGLANVKEVSLDTVTNATLPPVEDSGVIYKVTVPKSKGTEYFLFENRQEKGYDMGLGRYGGVKTGQFNPNMHGLLAYHVDDNVMYRNFWRPEEGQDANPNRTAYNAADAGTGEWHYGVGLIQADGKFDLEKYANSGDGGDAYPGTTNKTDLTFSKNFYSGSYFHGAPFGVKNIQEQNGVVTANFVPSN